MEVSGSLAPWILGLFGAFVGSFLNVCIYRMPAHRSIVAPGSACPSCGTPIRPWHNVPILSWIVLRGQCASCEAPISWRYPFIEALTAAVFVGVAIHFETPWAIAKALVFLSAMIVLFFTDLDERILPDLVTLPGVAAGIGFAFFAPSAWPFASRAELRAALVSAGMAAAAALIAGGALWLVGRLWLLLRPGLESAMGQGDVKMLAMIGAFLGGRLTLFTVFVGSLLGTALFLAVRLALFALPTKDRAGHPPPPLRGLRRGLAAAGFLVEGRGAGLLDQIPFGCFLAIGASIALVWGDALIDGYLALAASLGGWIADAAQGSE